MALVILKKLITKIIFIVTEPIEFLYTFSHAVDERIYNPTLCLYFFKQFKKSCEYPRKMLDSNLATDESKLEYIAQIPKGRELLMSLMQKNQEVVIPDIEDRFGIREILADRSKNKTFLVSFLYYFEVLTIAEDTDDLEVILKIPNLVMKSLYVERIMVVLIFLFLAGR